MGRLFGTDGVRGVANRDLTPELAFRLGRAAASVLLKSDNTERPVVLVGRDTRASGQMLECALVAGLTSAGADVLLVGVLPTPGVAYLTREMADAGAMISASHNPVEDNGIKFFYGDGYKLPDETEDLIEEAMSQELPRPIGVDVGRVKESPDAIEKYVEFLSKTVDESLSGLRVVVDCGNGAAYRVAPMVLKKLGAEVIALNTHPDGGNINVECGSTHPQVVVDAVKQHNANVGLSHDGDADRLIAVDETGQIVDGDHILAICAIEMLSQGQLAGNAIAATVYSNLGLRDTLKNNGGDVIITPNGDRYVLAAMREKGLVLGGEQSGHIIFLNHNTTGDGVLSGLKLLEVVKRSGKGLSSLAKQMTTYPQVLKNVRVRTKDGWKENQAVQDAISDAEKTVGSSGRVFVRASGTEPLIRVMVEGKNCGTIESAANIVATAIMEQFG